MVVLTALRQTPGALRRNPVLFVPVSIVAMVQLPQLVLQSVDPLISSLVSFAISLLFLLIVPFFQAGTIGMADEALDGVTSLETFIRDGRSKYIAFLVAFLVVFAVNVVIGMGVLFAAVIGGAVVFVGGGTPGLVELVVIGALGLIVLLVYLGFVFFVQFYGQAIVIDDRSAIAGLRRSSGLVRRNLLSTLGYSVVVGVIGGFVGLLAGAASIVTSPRTAEIFDLPDPSLPLVVGIGLLVVVGGTLVGGFLTTYSVAYYREIRDSSPS